MKKIFAPVLALACLALTATGFAQELPQPSPAAEIEQRIGLTDVTVKYSRPGVKGRTLWGDLVPYDKVWRTGANKATFFSVSTEVSIEGKTLPAGDYAIFTIPGASEWTVIFSKNTEQWGTGDYKSEEDALRVSVKPVMGDHMVESLQFSFDKVNGNTAKLVFAWDKLSFDLSIGVDPHAVAEKNIEAAIKETENAFRTFNNAARYYIDNDKDPKQALEWATKSVSMSEKFWNVYVLSLAQAANGQHKEAIKTAERSKELAIAADYQPYVKRNDDNIAKWKAM